MWKLKQCFLGAHGDSHPRHGPPWPLAYGPPWGEASPQVVQLSSMPARLAHAAESKSDGEAEARLNVKGFNMGENSP